MAKDLPLRMGDRAVYVFGNPEYIGRRGTVISSPYRSGSDMLVAFRFDEHPREPGKFCTFYTSRLRRCNGLLDV